MTLTPAQLAALVAARDEPLHAGDGVARPTVDALARLALGELRELQGEGPPWRFTIGPRGVAWLLNEAHRGPLPPSARKRTWAPAKPPAQVDARQRSLFELPARQRA